MARGATPDWDAVLAAVDRQRDRVTPGIGDMSAYLAKQVHDTSHREVLGPLLPASGASGVILHADAVARWGDPSVPEMAFSVTKSVVSTVAGVAVRLGILRDVEEPVTASVDLPEFAESRDITWTHLLQQTSGWHGELWGKPAAVDAQSSGTTAGAGEAGSAWAYNDVRVNLLCLALTALFREPLPAVLDQHVMGPLGASSSWSWHGYSNSTVELAPGRRLPVVSGGAHWGGGLFVSADDLALLGRLYLAGGRWRGREVLGREWIRRGWRPCALNPDYGYLWWLNTRRRIFPAAPATGVCARGNGGQHVLWLDPARDLVIAAHWSPDIGDFIGEVSEYVPPRDDG